MVGIIYCYTSPSGKKYIGQTINEQHRRNIFLNIKQKYSSGGKIDIARKKYGPENFKYEILQTVKARNKEDLLELLNKLEIYYIQLYNTFQNGYNSCIGGDNHGRVFSEDERRYRSSYMKERCDGKQPEHLKDCWKSSLLPCIEEFKKPVRQYSLEGLFIKEWPSVSSILKTIDNNLHISDCCLNKITQSGGYIWRFSEDTFGLKINTNPSKRSLNMRWNIDLYRNGVYNKTYIYFKDAVLDLFKESTDDTIIAVHKLLQKDVCGGKWIIKL